MNPAALHAAIIPLYAAIQLASRSVAAASARACALISVGASAAATAISWLTVCDSPTVRVPFSFLSTMTQNCSQAACPDFGDAPVPGAVVAGWDDPELAHPARAKNATAHAALTEIDLIRSSCQSVTLTARRVVFPLLA